MSRDDHPQVFDITFIGAGPTGLFGAFYAGMRELSVKLIDSLPQPGGQLTVLYPTKVIYDTPGIPAIVARDLVSDLAKQASRWNPVLLLDETAQRLVRAPIPTGQAGGECWLIETNRGRHWSRAMILTAGIGAFEPVRMNNESILRFEGRGVQYMVKDPHDFAGQRVLIVGGGDSAVDWALALEPEARQTTLIHRREGFRAHDASVSALMSSKVNVRVFHEIRQLEGESRLERAILFDNRTQEETLLDVDSVIMALGFKADLGPIREWGIETVGQRYLKVNQRMETNLPLVYAAGDLALQEGLEPLNLIVMGYGQVTIAVNYAYTALKPGGKVFPGHSSVKMEETGR
jgi:thioredoxin reductase